jgi:hypothetical protein
MKAYFTRIPLVHQPNENMGSETINKFRIQLLLWVLYSELTPELLLSPAHTDLKKLSAVIAAFLEKRFKEIPRVSSVKEFLSRPNSENVILRSTISEIKGLSARLSEIFKVELNPQKRRTLCRISQMLENIDIQWSAN